jgi:DNA repair protein RadC
MADTNVLTSPTVKTLATPHRCPYVDRLSRNADGPAISNAQSALFQSTGQACPWPDQVLNRLLAAFDSLDHNQISETECLELLIYLTARRDDSRALAASAIRTFGSLANLFSRSAQELRAFFGMDLAISAAIAIARTSMKLVLIKDTVERKLIDSHSSLIDYLALELRYAQQETLRVLYFDAKNRLIKDEEMSKGTVDEVSIFPREIGRRASTFCSSSVILAHNHLSDDPTPSREDIEATLQTKRVLENLDIFLQDHVIIARRGEFSMRQEKLI